MNRKNLILLLPLALGACCAGHSLVLDNNSGQDQQVTVLERPTGYCARKGVVSITAADEKKFIKKNTQNIDFTLIDSSLHAYAFILPKGKKALLQNGIGFPDMDQVLILNHSDTISLRSDRRVTVNQRIDYFFAVKVMVQ